MNLSVPNTKRVIYFDGICNLCNFWIRWVRRFDKNKVFQFQSLQSANQEGILQGEVLEMDSVVYSIDGKLHFESDAILKIIYDLGGKFRFLYFFLRLFPRLLRQAIYKFIARNRYRFFGTCELDGTR
jgi:predicted DCC family thiol-disulfide oxidoreductase YuxK